MSASDYKNLFSPLRVGNMELKNRMIMSPMGDGLANREGNVTEEMIAYYGARAQSGLGLYICRLLCERHSGALTVENGVQGAKVTAYFKSSP